MVHFSSIWACDGWIFFKFALYALELIFSPVKLQSFESYAGVARCLERFPVADSQCQDPNQQLPLQPVNAAL